MTLIGKLLVGLGLQADEYHKGLNEAEVKAKTSAASIGKSLGDIGGKLTGVGMKMSLGITAPVIGIFGAAINKASDLNETMNKVEAVFGTSTNAVLEFSKTSAQALGQSQQQALDAASTFGIFGKAAGLSGDDLSDFSTELTTLSADFASFYNTSPEEAITAIGAALRGESEPIRRYGVLLDDATLRNAALKMGLIETTKDALTPQQRTLAAYNVIMQQSTVAQGDFAKTADGLANSTRIAKAELADTAAKTGQMLLPMFLKLITFASGLLEKFNALSPETQKLILIFLGVAAAIGPVLVVVGSLISAIGAIIPVVATIGPVVAGIGGALLGPLGLVLGAVVLLAVAWKNNWFGMREAVAKARDFIMPIFNFFSKQFHLLGKVWTEILKGNWAQVRRLMQDGMRNVEMALKVLWGAIEKWFKSIDWKKVGTDIVQFLAKGLVAGIGFLRDAAVQMVTALIQSIKDKLGIHSPSTVIREEVGQYMGQGAKLGWADEMQGSFSVMGNLRGGEGRTAAPVTVNYNPMLGLADEAEAKRVLKPIIKDALREIQLGV